MVGRLWKPPPPCLLAGWRAPGICGICVHNVQRHFFEEILHIFLHKFFEDFFAIPGKFRGCFQV